MVGFHFYRNMEKKKERETNKKVIEKIELFLKKQKTKDEPINNKRRK